MSLQKLLSTARSLSPDFTTRSICCQWFILTCHLYHRGFRGAGQGNCLPQMWRRLLPVSLFGWVSLSHSPMFIAPNIDTRLSVSRLNTDCHQTCPDRTYSSKDNMLCAPCQDKQCAICDQAQCYWCEEGFYVSGNFWSIHNCGWSSGVSISW